MRKFFYVCTMFLATMGLFSCDKDDDEEGEDAKPATEQNGKYTYVDLGLSVKWATCNVGANSPEGYGDYFAWGETTGYNSGKTNFSWSTYKLCNGSSSSLTKYCTSTYDGTVDNKTVLDSEDDAATANWGTEWRIPAKAEWQELLDNCTWTWTQVNGVNGYKVTSNKSGYTDKSIFLPAAGCREDSDLKMAGAYGGYWTNSLYGEEDDDYLASGFYIASNIRTINFAGRYFGQSIRPVYGQGNAAKVTGITFSSSYAEVEIGKTLQLTATISPSNATVKTLQWTSSNTSVASISNTGLVTAKALGVTVITAIATDGSGLSATCTVAVGAKTETHEYVDLGLSIKWATCNVGANNPDGYGDYFAWGETKGYKSGKTTFDWSTYKWCDGSSSSMTKYCINSSFGTVDNKTVLEPSDDAATANWGAGWRMPTQAEIQELITSCTWAWTKQNGVNGYKVTSKKSGYTDKSIFLPAAGVRYENSHLNSGSLGGYSSSSLFTNNSGGMWYIFFTSSKYYAGGDYRIYGLSVRPVYTK